MCIGDRGWKDHEAGLKYVLFTFRTLSLVDDDGRENSINGCKRCSSTGFDWLRTVGRDICMLSLMANLSRCEDNPYAVTRNLSIVSDFHRLAKPSSC